MKTIFNYRQPRSLSDLINTQLARRLYSHSKVMNTYSGGKLAIFANEHIGIQINQHGVYDRISLELLFAFLAPISDELKQSTAFDIGANIGNHALYFSRYLSCVHAFEPEPRTFELLKLNSALVDNLVPHPIGLGDEQGRFLLHGSFQNTGASSIVHSQREGRTVEISVDTIDNLFGDIGDLALVKIDVEGFEVNVLRGGMETIRRNQPVITFEQWETEFQNGTSESISLLQEAGYRFCWPEQRHGGDDKFSRPLNAIIDATVRRAREFEIVTADSIPKRKYKMLIAVPERFRAALGFQ